MTRRLTTLNAIEVDSLLTNSQSLTLAASAGLGLVSVTAIAVATQIQQTKKVASISPTKLPMMLANSNTVLVDIRSKADVRSYGLPDLKGLDARLISAPYTKRTPDGEQIFENYGEAFAKVKKLREGDSLILMDYNGNQAPKAAREILQFLNFDTVFYVANGASGKGGLQDSGFAWKDPQKGLQIPNINIGALDLDRIAETYKERPTLFNTGLAVGALATAAVVLFNEFDLILETVGIVGGVNIFLKNFLFAKERKKTLDDLDALLNDKIAPKEAGEDLKRLANAILELSPESVPVTAKQE